MARTRDKYISFVETHLGGYFYVRIFGECKKKPKAAKTFLVHNYKSKESARITAKKWRNKTAKALGINLDKDYRSLRIGKTGEGNTNTGIVGVRLEDFERHYKDGRVAHVYGYRAVYRKTRDGERVNAHKFFSIKRYGKDLAFTYAKRWRRKMERENYQKIIKVKR